MAHRWLVGFVLAILLWTPAADALEGVRPGMKAPPISLGTLDGKRVSLADFAGARAFLLVFWATWSEKSPELLERVEKLHARYREKGFIALGINAESPALTAEEVVSVKTMVGRLRLSFPILLDRGLEVFGTYGVVAVPSSVLIGGDGTILGDLAAYPIAGREEFFELVEATVLGRQIAKRASPQGPQPNPRAVRYFNLARAMVARGLVDQVDGNLKKAIELDPAFPLPRILLGQLYRERALSREAIQFNGEAVATLRISAEDRAAFLREAERLLGEAARLDPRDSAALTELGLIYASRGDSAKARESLERALSLNPGYSPARSHLGALLMAAGQTERGRAELKAAIQLNPLDWRLHITAAQAYEGRGMLRQALEEYRRGVELLWQARRELFPLSYGR